MSERPIHDDLRDVEPLRVRYKTEHEQQAGLLDLIQRDSNGAVPFERRGNFFISPGQTYELIRQTRIRRMLLPEGEMMTRGTIRELLNPGKFGSPTVGAVPDRAYWRSYLDQIDPNDPDSWSRMLGVVFEFDMGEEESSYDVLDRVVTGREEVGLLMVSGGMQAYRMTAILINHEELLIEEPCVSGVRAGEVSEFITNMKGLMATPKEGFLVPPELAGIDLAEFDIRFGDRMDL